MTERIELEHDERLHKLHHDMGHCLHVICMAAEILKTNRNDERRMMEVCGTIEKEGKSAAKLLNEFLNTACNACGAEK